MRFKKSPHPMFTKTKPAEMFPRVMKTSDPLSAYELLGPIMSVSASLSVTHSDVGKLGT